jgi:xanthine dehydrogenase small subunit
VARRSIQFLRNGSIVELGDFPPMTTLLDYLRLTEKSRGTKEGCGEGDCGACTVAVGTLRDGKVVYEPVNACIALLGQFDGKEVVTVDDLAGRNEKLHPVQQALVDRHGSQCGFCTPGFVMSLFTLYHSGKEPSRQNIVDHLAGNLCRCTGYRSIIDAAGEACKGRADDKWTRSLPSAARMLSDLDDGADVLVGDEQSFFAAPASVDSLAALAAKQPDAVILSGGTDVGLWITKQLRTIPKIIHIGRVSELHNIADKPDALTLGSAVTYAEAEPHLAAIDPDFGELIRRLGSKQVRAVGTVGGNIANGSPIGDMPPALIALGATIELRKGASVRTLPLEAFFIAYGEQDRAAGEILTSLTVPKLKRGEQFRCYKISKRFDQDISAVMGAFKLTIRDGRIVEARIAFGGMAATPRRSPAAEAALKNALPGDRKAWDAAASASRKDFTPITDQRAGAAYRLDTAQALLLKALTEIGGEESSTTRVVGLRTAQHAV